MSGSFDPSYVHRDKVIAAPLVLAVGAGCDPMDRAASPFDKLRVRVRQSPYAELVEA